MTLENLLHRPRQEVLAVHAQPLAVTPREVPVAALVTIAEVAGMEPAAARARCRRLGVLVVALEEPRACGVDDLADGFLGIRHAAVRVAPSGRTRIAALVQDLDA